MTAACRVFTAAVPLLLLTVLVYSHLIDAFDKRLLLEIVEAQSANSVLFWRSITWAGAPTVVFGIAMVIALFLFVRTRRSEAKFIALAMIAASILDAPFKYLVHRSRPLETLAIAMPTSFSFPSGHVLFATVFYVSLAMVFVKHRATTSSRMIWLCAGSVIALVTLSRLSLGVHYPSDVLGGLLAGLFCISLANSLTKTAPSQFSV